MFNAVVLLSARGPGLLVQIHDIMDSIKYQQLKKLNLLTAPACNHVTDHGWIFQQAVQKQTSKLKQKWVTEHKTKHLE